jgi:two-component system sensor histidine kinase FlrB
MVHQPLNSAEGLQDAFQVFNELSQNLTRSYLELEAQVARLTRELAAARSERLKTLTEKESLANRLQRLLQALPGAVLVTDGRGVIVEHNPAAQYLLGAGLLGRCWREVLDDLASPGSDNPHQRQLQSGKTVSISVNSLGEQPGQIVLLTDVSEMRALQELVNQQKRLSALGEMVASLAHQVRTPLSAALLYTAHLGNGELNPFQRERFAAKLADRLQYMERQVNDMLAFARIGRLAMEKIFVAGFVRSVAEAFEPTLQGRHIAFSVQNRVEANVFCGNPDALLGVLLNLLHNAVEALDGVGEINLELGHPAPGWLRMVVSDNGPGIAEDIRGRIFEPFFTTRANGTGLGLAIVECVVRAHGGRVSCQSSKGLGAAFLLDFPLAEPFPLPGGFSGKGHSLGGER